MKKKFIPLILVLLTGCGLGHIEDTNGDDTRVATISDEKILGVSSHSSFMMISNSIQKDWKNQMYSEYIELDRDAKRLFPQKIRSYSRDSEERESQRNSIEVKTEQGTYVIEISKKVKIIKEGYK